LVLGIADPVRFLIDLAAFLAIYSTLSVSLNPEYGFCGIPNLGKVLFFAAGAFAVGGLFPRLTIWVFGLNLAGLDFTKDNALIVTQATLGLSGKPFVAMVFSYSCLLWGPLWVTFSVSSPHTQRLS
jgi:ABC-type branched-subunit amino acid transport system permease subunit